MPKILIVDDSRLARSFVRAILETEGYEIAGEARNGLEGYKMYLEEKPDLVTMDVTMPVMDGIKALRKIRESDPSAKVIMITSNMQHKRISDALDANSADYLPKPVKHRELIDAVRRLLD